MILTIIIVVIGIGIVVFTPLDSAAPTFPQQSIIVLLMLQMKSSLLAHDIAKALSAGKRPRVLMVSVLLVCFVPGCLSRSNAAGAAAYS